MGITMISVIRATRIINIGLLGGGESVQVVVDFVQVHREDPICNADFFSRQVSYEKIT